MLMPSIFRTKEEGYKERKRRKPPVSGSLSVPKKQVNKKIR